MKRILVVMMVCFMGTVSVSAGKTSSLSPYFAVEMLNGNGFDWKSNDEGFSDPGISFGTSSGMNIRVGLNLFSFISLEEEWVQLSGFWVKYRGVNLIKLKPTSFFTNLKLRPLELFLKNPILSPYFIYGIGATNLEILKPAYTNGKKSFDSEKVSYDSYASTKLGTGINVPVNKNLYIYSEISWYNSTFHFLEGNDYYTNLNLRISYSAIGIGAGYKF